MNTPEIPEIDPFTTEWNAGSECCFELGYAAAHIYRIARKDISPARRIKALRYGLADLNGELDALEILTPRTSFADVVDACRQAVIPIRNPADVDEWVWIAATDALALGLRSLACQKARSDPMYGWLAVGLLTAIVAAGFEDCKLALINFLRMAGVPADRAEALAALNRQLKQSIEVEIASRFSAFWIPETNTLPPRVGVREVRVLRIKRGRANKENSNDGKTDDRRVPDKNNPLARAGDGVHAARRQRARPGLRVPPGF